MDGGGFSGSTTRQLRSSTFGSVCKQSEMCDKQKHLSTGKSFIKVIERQDLAKQLQIPEEFKVNFKGNVPHRFIIESTTTKKCWRVEVEKDEDGRVYFGEGWNDFVKAHSVEVGSFLVFEYEEQSIFQVKIYGKNGCEKTKFGGNEQGLHKLEKTVEFEEVEESESDDYEENTSTKCPRRTRKLSPGRCEHGIYKKNGDGRTYIRATEVSITKNSIGFSTTLHKRKRYQFRQLAIPRAVSAAKKLSSVKEVLLQNVKGNRWLVGIMHRRDSHGVYFVRGWKEFLDDNKIVGGDKLSFRFISDTIIQVHVTRSSEVEHHSGAEASGLLNTDCEDDELVTCTTDEKAIEASASRKRSASGFKSSSFSFTWRERTSGVYLHIPKAVAEDQNLNSKDRVLLRDPEGKCWPLLVKTRPDGRVALTKGWFEFWKGHNITAGDSLYFEFMSECLIQVAIHRGKLPLDPAIRGAINDPEATGNGQTTSQQKQYML